MGKYYIIGGNGFVGRYLANELIVLDKLVVVCDVQDELNEYIDKKCEYAKIDIRDKITLNRLNIVQTDVVINLAANQYHTKVPKDKRNYFFSVNVEGVENILSVIFDKGCRNYIMFTTDMVYGKPQYLPVDTNHPKNPFGLYGESKKRAEDICKEYRLKEVNITIFRPRMINGPGRLGILVKLFKFIDLGLPVPMIGSGKNHYQMISVYDCVSAILCAITHNIPNKEYNLGSKGSPNIKELLKSVVETAHSKSLILPTPGKLVKALLGFCELMALPIMYKEQYMIADEEYILDISETEKDLGWSPKYNDSDMIKEAYQLYRTILK